MLDHKHVIFNCITKNKIDSVEVGNDFLRSIVKAVEMKILIDAHSIYCDDPDNEGLTGTICLTTSHSSFHQFLQKDGNHKLSFDLYSCKEFDPIIVHKIINEYFNIVSYDGIIIDRNKIDNNSVQIISG